MRVRVLVFFNSNTQEACLFRQTNLKEFLNIDMYPICKGRTRTTIPYTARIIYSPNVTVMKNINGEDIPHFKISVISSAAAACTRRRLFLR